MARGVVGGSRGPAESSTWRGTLVTIESAVAGRFRGTTSVVSDDGDRPRRDVGDDKAWGDVCRTGRAGLLPLPAGSPVDITAALCGASGKAAVPAAVAVAGPRW